MVIGPTRPVRRRRTVAAETFVFWRCLLVSRSSRLAADSSPTRGASCLWQPIGSQNEWPYCRISPVGSKTSMSAGERDDVSHPHERRKAHGLLRATSRRVVSGMLIARDEKTHSNNCGPRSDQPRSSSQMYRFVQIEKRAPAPLTSVRSLKCSQSQLMPQMRFVQAAIPQFFRPTDQMW